MMTKKLLPLAVASGLLMGTAGFANAEGPSNGFSASANVTLTSDYKFRGISQSDESPAIQGGFDIEHESGFYGRLAGRAGWTPRPPATTGP